MLDVKAINTSYGAAQVLFDLSLNVKEAECVSLLGRNGAGKTTALRSIVNLNRPRSGSVLYKGQEITSLQTHRVAQLGIGLVPEDRRVFPGMSVETNLQLGVMKTARNGIWDLERVYMFFPKLKELRHRSGEFLSGGEQQMLSIARCLMGNPSLMLLDEPTEGLAPIIVQELTELIARLKREGMTILLVEQNVNVALAVADRCYVLDHGTVVFDGTAEHVRNNEKIREEYLGV